MTDQLPSPPIPAEVDLTDFLFMPLEVSRLRRSKAWLICKRRPDLAFYMINLWTASWHERPAGSLEDDDDVLADLAMCPPKEWARIRSDVMRGWVRCSDGRFYHPVVIEKVIESWRSKLRYAYEKECERQRKAAVRAGMVKEFVPPTFEEWEMQRVSVGQSSLSGGRPRTSGGQPQLVQRTSQVCPPENALKGQVRDSKGIGKGHTYTASDGHPLDTKGREDGQPVPAPAPISEPDHLERLQTLKASYPAGLYRQSEWQLAEREVRQREEEGEPFSEMLAGAQRFAKQCDAKGSTGTQFVMSPTKFFRERHYREQFPLPANTGRKSFDERMAALNTDDDPTGERH